MTDQVIFHEALIANMFLKVIYKQILTYTHSINCSVSHSGAKAYMENSRASGPAVSLNGLQHGEIACEMCYVHDNASLLGKQGAIIHHLARQYYI